MGVIFELRPELIGRGNNFGDFYVDYREQQWGAYDGWVVSVHYQNLEGYPYSFETPLISIPSDIMTNDYEMTIDLDTALELMTITQSQSTSCGVRISFIFYKGGSPVRIEPYQLWGDLGIYGTLSHAVTNPVPAVMYYRRASIQIKTKGSRIYYYIDNNKIAEGLARVPPDSFKIRYTAIPQPNTQWAFFTIKKLIIFGSDTPESLMVQLNQFVNTMIIPLSLMMPILIMTNMMTNMMTLMTKTLKVPKRKK